MGSKIYVGGLPYFATESELSDLFAQHGTVQSVNLITDRFTGQSRGFGYVEMTTKEDSTELGLQYKNARIDLQEAHKSMMDWMQGFGNRFDSDEILNGKELSDQKQLWLDEEEEKVKALRNQINSSIEKAKKLLDKS